jgi:hypothetical protein
MPLNFFASSAGVSWVVVSQSPPSPAGAVVAVALGLFVGFGVVGVFFGVVLGVVGGVVGAAVLLGVVPPVVALFCGEVPAVELSGSLDTAAFSVVSLRGVCECPAIAVAVPATASAATATPPTTSQRRGRGPCGPRSS